MRAPLKEGTDGVAALLENPRIILTYNILTLATLLLSTDVYDDKGVHTHASKYDKIIRGFSMELSKLTLTESPTNYSCNSNYNVISAPA